VLDQCASCHQAIDVAEASMFSHVLGGATCRVCETQVRGGRRLPPEARDTLRGWLEGADVVPPDGASCRAHVRLLREFVQHHVSEGVELRAFGTWEAGFA
jgi:hypothetical protein